MLINVALPTILSCYWFSAAAPEPTGVEIIKSRCGKELVLFRNFTYCYARKADTLGTTHWRCTSVNSKNCKAKIVLGHGKRVIQMKGKHTHSPVEQDALQRIRIWRNL
ncbi:hypothetical protein O3G_MSEX002005 [Manduca sexta]|uniref:FLYWCH-type domain-containing protein n=1 Tax=Manduca sexta TaxID=7130 RepID=A0A921YLX1_MANSE|nr:hypothetical protein O3G_MSEX002005 [Manduca sexta]